MIRRWLQGLLGAAALVAAVAAQADTRAWLDRERIELGETATLNIESDRPGADAPDFSALSRDFELSGHSSRRSAELVNGRRQSRVLFAVALRPKRDGLLPIPALQVAGESTRPLTLTVLPATVTRARAGQPAFIEAEVDTRSPYVQQPVAYVLRLYYATPLVSGQLDQAQPEGAALTRIGNDLQYTRDVGGRRYSVVERRFRLIPERSGTLAIPGARFQGRGVGGMLDEFFGDGRRELRASGPPTFLQVQPMPDAAPQPWLPVRALALRWVSTPQALRAGEAASVTVEMTADGAIAAQLPELELGPLQDAQVFADPPQLDETMEDGRMRVRVTRRFSVVPARAGVLVIPGPRQDWWDARAGVARTASLPDLRLDVEAGAPDAGVEEASAPAPRQAGEAGPGRWPWIAAAFALLWLLTLAWALASRRHRPPSREPGAGIGAGSGEHTRHAPRPTLNTLMRTLDTGDLGEVAAVLCDMAEPPAPDLDAVSARLEDPAQRAAIAQLQRARWGGDSPGAAAAARAALREAFRSGAHWRSGSAAATPLLPPLYPP